MHISVRHVIITFGILVGLFIYSMDARGQVRINEVDYEDGWVELFNEGNSATEVSGYYLCTFPTYVKISDLNAITGTTSMGPGDFLVVEWSAGNFTTSDGEVGLYFNNNNFGDSNNMADYMEYGSGGHTRESVAIGAGEWESGEFVPLAPSGKTVSFFETQGEVGEEDWQASNETQGSANDPIPVELVSFDAVTEGRTVHLAWKTASETNNAGFEVHHKHNGPFETIGFVEGHGTTNTPQSYRYMVNDLEAGAHTFRLKQVDFDGAFEFSPKVEIQIQMNAPYTLSAVYPNPASQTAQFTLAVRETQAVMVEVYDVTGRRVATLYQGTMEAGRTHQFELGGKQLANGFYLIRTNGEHFTTTRDLTLVK